MEQHIRIVAILFIILGVLGALVGLFLFLLIFGAGVASQDRDAMFITGTVGVAIAAFCLVISVPSIIAGIGIQKHRAWARILAIVIAVLNLFNFPVGTAIGAYAMWALLSEESKNWFR
jgi:hypothetical protein